jgi:hypothetical protein
MVKRAPYMHAVRCRAAVPVYPTAASALHDCVCAGVARYRAQPTRRKLIREPVCTHLFAELECVEGVRARGGPQGLVADCKLHVKLLVQQLRLVVQLHKLEVLAAVLQVGPPHEGSDANLEPAGVVRAVQLADGLGDHADAGAARKLHREVRHADAGAVTEYRGRRSEPRKLATCSDHDNLRIFWEYKTDLGPAAAGRGAYEPIECLLPCRLSARWRLRNQRGPNLQQQEVGRGDGSTMLYT